MKYVFSKKDALRADLDNPRRTAFVWVDVEQGAKKLSGGSAEIPVGSELPYHIHESEEEMMFIYKGTGVAVADGVESPLGPETMVFMPPGVRHTFKNTGTEPLCFAFFYSPPGPEQNIRRLAKK
jgi:mannose-6-phosphate isomerase-like protein (cupin superfamily)